MVEEQEDSIKRISLAAVILLMPSMTKPLLRIAFKQKLFIKILNYSMTVELLLGSSGYLYLSE